MSRTSPKIRDVQIKPLSMRTELGNVIRLGMGILFCVVLCFSVELGGSTVARRNLLPFQTVIQDRPSIEQLVFRELREGLLEAEVRRSTAGAWPEVAVLAADGVPPFTFDPTAKAATYKWQLVHEGIYINYIGIPDKPGSPAWLVLIQEPGPGSPPDPAKEDEDHHRLLDGTTLHVSTWIHPDGMRVTMRLVRIPQAEGWTQLYAVGPSPVSR
jgi:hypothetical protein